MLDTVVTLENEIINAICTFESNGYGCTNKGALLQF